jgi:hypothetical protein
LSIARIQAALSGTSPLRKKVRAPDFGDIEESRRIEPVIHRNLHDVVIPRHPRAFVLPFGFWSCVVVCAVWVCVTDVSERGNGIMNVAHNPELIGSRDDNFDADPRLRRISSVRNDDPVAMTEERKEVAKLGLPICGYGSYGVSHLLVPLIPGLLQLFILADCDFAALA